MNSDIDAPIQKRRLELLRKKPLVANLAERGIEDFISLRIDHLDAHIQSRKRRAKHCFDCIRLPESQRATACSDYQIVLQ